MRVSWGLDTLGNWTEGAGATDQLGQFLHSGRVEETRDSLGDYALDLAQDHQTDLRNQLDGIEIDDGSGNPPAVEISVHDPAGNLVADDAYWYQYDAFNRLASVHLKGSLNFDAAGAPTSGTPGAWKLYLAYDALGRLISLQKPWSTGTDHRKAFLFYDGVRRILEVFQDPVLGQGGPVGGGGGGGGGGYTTYTDREYVWGPDYVDECLWQVSKTGDLMHVLQDASMDVVATLNPTGAVARQWSYDPYGRPIVSEQLAAGAHNRLGHHGLFFDRLDAAAPTAELDAAARGLYHNRNRTYDPRIGRLVSTDPHGTALATVIQAMQGRAPLADLSPVDIGGLYGDGMNRYGYLGPDPCQNWDPMGLFFGYDDLVMWGFGALRGGMEEMIGQYADNMLADVEWAMDWDMGDDWHTRNDNSWVNISFAMGALRGLIDEVDPGLGISDYVYAGTGSAAGKTAKMARRVRPIRELNRREIVESYYKANKSLNKLPGEHSHHLVEQQMGGPWKRSLDGSGPAIHVEAGFHRSVIRVKFNEAYAKVGVTNPRNMTLAEAEQVIKIVYRDAPRLRNATLKYLRGK